MVYAKVGQRPKKTASKTGEIVVAVLLLLLLLLLLLFFLSLVAFDFNVTRVACYTGQSQSLRSNTANKGLVNTNPYRNAPFKPARK